jgi:hypothetical protein
MAKWDRDSEYQKENSHSYHELFNIRKNNGFRISNSSLTKIKKREIL